MPGAGWQSRRLRGPAPARTVAIARHNGRDVRDAAVPARLIEKKPLWHSLPYPPSSARQRCRRLVRRAPPDRPCWPTWGAGTLTLADVLGRDDDLARKTRVAQVVRELPGVGKARATAIMERAGIPAERRIGGLGARQREQLLTQFPGEWPSPVLVAISGGVRAKGPPGTCAPSGGRRWRGSRVACGYLPGQVGLTQRSSGPPRGQEQACDLEHAPCWQARQTVRSRASRAATWSGDLERKAVRVRPLRSQPVTFTLEFSCVGERRRSAVE